MQPKKLDGGLALKTGNDTMPWSINVFFLKTRSKSRRCGVADRLVARQAGTESRYRPASKLI